MSGDPLAIPLMCHSFWGDRVHAVNAGPPPIPADELTPSRLAEAIRIAQSPEIRSGAARLGQKLRSENGAAAGEESFYRHLPLQRMMCVSIRRILSFVRRPANPTGAKPTPPSPRDGGVTSFTSESRMWRLR